jgi:peptide/nickel transport system permease protein
VHRYIIRRLLLTLPILLGITIMIFAMISMAPGDPVLAMLNPEAKVTDDVIDIMRKQAGLDRPIPVRYAIWLGAVVRGDLGKSYSRSEPTVDVIARRLPPTLLLMGTALIISVVLGVTLGIVVAVRQYSWIDYLLTPFSYAWVSVPTFFAGLAAIYIFSVNLKLLPTGGYSSAGATSPLLDHIRHLILPALILGLEATASIMRYTRSSVLEILKQDYMSVARSKGLTERAVLMRHALPNALISVVTIVGMRLPTIVAGAVIIESVFNWPGIGSLYVEAVGLRDYSVVMALSLLTAGTVLIANLLIDISYAFIDPRIRYS